MARKALTYLAPRGVKAIHLTSFAALIPLVFAVVEAVRPFVPEKYAPVVVAALAVVSAFNALFVKSLPESKAAQ